MSNRYLWFPRAQIRVLWVFVTLELEPFIFTNMYITLHSGSLQNECVLTCSSFLSPTVSLSFAFTALFTALFLRPFRHSPILSILTPIALNCAVCPYQAKNNRHIVRARELSEAGGNQWIALSFDRRWPKARGRQHFVPETCTHGQPRALWCEADTPALCDQECATICISSHKGE